jgi:PucR-like helix-turn-helix protein/diguanylate cyclase with GGDEF domain
VQSTSSEIGDDAVHGQDDDVCLEQLVPAVVDRVPAILAEVREILAHRDPDYAAFLAEEFDEIVAAAEIFVARLIAQAERSPSGEAGDVEQTLFDEIGRSQLRQGKSVIDLLAAYRSGATVAWRHISELALKLGVPSEAFAALATAVFTAVDQFSSASLRGYEQERSESALARERLRDELAELLLSDRSDSAAVRAAAARANWTVPAQIAVVVVDPDNDVGRTLLARLGDSCLRLRHPDNLVGIVSDPSGPGRRAWLANALRGAGAVVGVSVPPERLPASVPIAELAVSLRRAHLLDGDPLFVGEHLDALIVHRDDELLAALRRQYLAPLDQLPRPTCERLSATLKSWLHNMGNQKAIAAELHVHPQTVRYRLAQLRNHFGPVLDDPAARAALLLALGWGPSAAETAFAAAETEPRRKR